VCPLLTFCINRYEELRKFAGLLELLRRSVPTDAIIIRKHGKLALMSREMIDQLLMRFFVVLVTVACFVLLLGIIRGNTSIPQFFALRNSQEILAKTVEGLETENTKLKQEIEKLRSSKAYARKVLRDKYHVTDADETIIFMAE
jgi:cell division protein FtsB